MTTTELYEIIAEQIISKIQNSEGLAKFAKKRAKFEGWLKVEIIDVLEKRGKNVFPEVERIDVTFNDVAIELKTINTNIRYENVINTTRPITKNVSGIIDDIIT